MGKCGRRQFFIFLSCVATLRVTFLHLPTSPGVTVLFVDGVVEQKLGTLTLAVFKTLLPSCH